VLSILAMVFLLLRSGAVTGAPLTQPSVLLARPILTEAGRSDVGSSVLPIAGGALITGWTSVDDGPADGLLLRVTGDGDVVWRKQLGGAGVDLLWSVLPDPTGGYIGVGFTGSSGAGSLDGWILHLDGDGDIQWQHAYGGAGEDRLTSIQPAPYGWIAVGQTSGRGAGGIDAWVLRIDSAGKELSSWFSGGPDTDRAFGVHPTPDGGCVIGGMTGLEAPESFDLFVTHLGPDGRPIWTDRPRRPGLQVVHDLKPLPDGGWLAVGYGFVDEKQHIDAFVLRVSAAGGVTSESSFGGPTYDRANHGLILEDGTIAVVGYSQRPGFADEEHGWDLVSYRLDAQGTPISELRFGGEGFEFGRGISGGMQDLWVVGHTSTGRKGSSILLVRLDYSNPLLESGVSPGRRPQ